LQVGQAFLFARRQPDEVAQFTDDGIFPNSARAIPSPPINES